MNRFLSSAALAISLIVSAATPISLLLVTGTVRAEDNGLYYNFGNQKISLSVKTDSIAVVMTKTRGAKGESSLSQLQQDFGAGETLRGGAKSIATTQVRSVSTKYAMLTETNDLNGAEKLKQRVQGKAYIESTLPVLKIAGKSNSLLLPNETIVKFKPGVSSTERNAILTKNHFDPLSAKELRFAPGFYLVKPDTARGLEVLTVSNQLGKIQGVQSAMPNFIEIQSAPNRYGLDRTGAGGGEMSKAKLKARPNSNPKELLAGLDLKALQWHIDSQLMLGKMKSTGTRTDVRAPEAWSHGKKGDGVVVAVIDNLIQWDHPALANRIVTVDCNAQKLMACAPGEQHGWDFSNGEEGDNDTRISAEELESLRPEIEESLKSDSFLQAKYADLIPRIKARNQDFSEAQVMEVVRDYVRENSVGSFHGTMSTGMIAGSASNGFQGIAPNVKILPVRAGGLGLSLSTVAILNSIGYAADRGADIINMSFGSDLPTELEANLIADLQKQYPKLVFVASAGNENTPASGYPGAYPEVISVGAIGVKGNRAAYSNYGRNLTVVAPGGDTDVDGGVLTLSGIGAKGFWQNVPQPTGNFPPFQDHQGYYVFTQGTSFAAPAVVGVLALMKSADPQRKLTARQYRQILTSTSSREGLSLTSEELAAFAENRQKASSDPVSGEQFYFGSGLVNAEKAVAAVEQMQRN